MNIIFKKDFVKRYKKLSSHDREKVDSAINIFRKNPKEFKLKDHQLSGSMKGLRSISAGFDLRIIYREFENYTVVYMMEVGTHAQIYNG